MHEILFTINFTRNIFKANFTDKFWKFYNFVKNNYSWRNYVLIKIPRKKKGFFLQNFIRNLQTKNSIKYENLVMYVANELIMGLNIGS